MIGERMTAATARPVLLVEDNRDDISFVRRAFARASLINPLVVARSAAEARRAVAGAGTDPRSLPLLVLLDLTLRGAETGLEFMSWLRAQESPAAEIPTVLYTVSVDRTEEAKAVALGALGFLRKPITADALIDVVTSIGLMVGRTGDGDSRFIHER